MQVNLHLIFRDPFGEKAHNHILRRLIPVIPDLTRNEERFFYSFLCPLDQSRRCARRGFTSGFRIFDRRQRYLRLFLHNHLPLLIPVRQFLQLGTDFRFPDLQDLLIVFIFPRPRKTLLCIPPSLQTVQRHAASQLRFGDQFPLGPFGRERHGDFGVVKRRVVVGGRGAGMRHRSFDVVVYGLWVG